MTAVSPKDRPHSRACGMWHHEHGSACASDCPSCYEDRSPPEPAIPIAPATITMTVRLRLSFTDGQQAALDRAAALVEDLNRLPGVDAWMEAGFVTYPDPTGPPLGPYKVVP